jgi:hypothetical protein
MEEKFVDACEWMTENLPRPLACFIGLILGVLLILLTLAVAVISIGVAYIVLMVGGQFLGILP